MNSKWTTDLHVKLRTTKLPEKNVQENLHDLGLGKVFLDLTEKQNLS